jgi:hypothetical protein
MARVSDQEPFYSPNAKPAVPRQTKPGERVWTLQKAGRRIECELRFHGESYGWEAQFLYGGELAYGRRFVLKAGALEEAEAQRERLSAEGWV